MWTGSTEVVHVTSLNGAISFQISIFGLFDIYVTKPSDKHLCHMCRCINLQFVAFWQFSLVGYTYTCMHITVCIHRHVCTLQCVYISMHTHSTVGIHLHVCMLCQHGFQDGP